MRPLILLFTLIPLALMLNSCSSSPYESLKAYEGQTPAFQVREYFSGPVKAWGMIQNFSGKQIRRLDADLYGVWEGDKGELYEYFLYDDGEEYRRIWHLTAEGDDRFTGTAHDIVGKAQGAQRGNAAFWKYVMEVPVDGTIYKLSFDDKMWLINDDILVNKTKMKKFGITVGYITIFMQKQPADAPNKARPETFPEEEMK